MIVTLLLIGLFYFTYQRFVEQSVWTTAAAIPGIAIAGLLAINFFEPAALAIVKPSAPLVFLGSEADFVCIVAIFVAVIAAFGWGLTNFPDLPPLPEQFESRASRLLSVIASYLVVAISLTACDTSPRLRSMLGLRTDSAALLGLVAPDAQWLNFVEIIADGSMRRPAHLLQQKLTQQEQSPGVSAGTQLQMLRQRYFQLAGVTSGGTNSATENETVEPQNENVPNEYRPNSVGGQEQTVPPTNIAPATTATPPATTGAPIRPSPKSIGFD